MTKLILMAFKQVTIIGTGLIGGSLGLALKKRRLAGRIIGCDRAPVLERAKDCGAIEAGASDPADAVRGSDLVVLSTPVIAILDLIAQFGPSLPAKTLVTDVGSTKVEVVQRAAKSFGRNAGQRFLAGHPMAGKEHSGIEQADADLFAGATWAITPSEKKIPEGSPAAAFLDLVRSVGAHILCMAPDRHDWACAWISHLPQFVSTALAASLANEFASDPEALELGGPTLRDMTRVAASPYSMWRDVALTNPSNIQEALLRLEQRLAHLRENLSPRELETEFAAANKLRKTLTTKNTKHRKD